MKKNSTLLFCLLTGFVLLTGHSSAIAQIGNNGYFYSAEKLFKTKQYFEAAQAFKKYLNSEQPSRSTGSPFAIEKRVKGMSSLNIHEEAVFTLAECYRNYNDYANAEKYYNQAIAFKDKAYALARFWYGISLRANGKYADAYEALTKFEENYTQLGPVLIRADKELRDLKFIRTQLTRKDTGSWIRQQPVVGNSSVYALTIENNDTVVFTSIHVDSAVSKKATTDYNAALYRYTLHNQAPDSAHPLDPGLPIVLKDSPDVHTGLACFTADGNRMFFTQWIHKNGKNHSAIYTCSRSDTGWSKSEKLPGTVNLDGYNSTQPFVTADNDYLLFASDRPGGLGGYDLYYARLDSNFISSDVTNLGDVINTSGDEQTPYYHQKNHTLVFSSTGHVGMGGFDIFYAKRSFDFTSWGEPRNPGIPINSSKDDQYYVSSDDDNCWNTGWLSSDRNSDCCLALYSVRENNTLLVTGKVIDCRTRQPIPNAAVTCIDHRHGDTLIGKKYTDSAGKYRLEMRNISAFHLQADKRGYDTASNDLKTTLEVGANYLDAPDLCLTYPKPDTAAIKEVLRTLSRSPTLANFDFKKHSLNKAAYPNLDSLIDLMTKNPTIIVEIGGYTDQRGPLALNMKLAKIRVDVCMQYLLKKGLKKVRLRTKAYGPCCPIQPETTPDGKDDPVARAMNRRVEYKLVGE